MSPIDLISSYCFLVSSESFFWSSSSSCLSSFFEIIMSIILHFSKTSIIISISIILNLSDLIKNSFLIRSKNFSSCNSFSLFGSHLNQFLFLFSCFESLTLFAWLKFFKSVKSFASSLLSKICWEENSSKTLPKEDLFLISLYWELSSVFLWEVLPCVRYILLSKSLQNSFLFFFHSLCLLIFFIQ